jgi:hypothetical protein
LKNKEVRKNTACMTAKECSAKSPVPVEPGIFMFFYAKYQPAAAFCVSQRKTAVEESI